MLRDKGQTIEISHFYRYVSAYVEIAENFERLRCDVKDAVDEAKKTGKPVIVEHDCIEHVFIVWPSGNLSLMINWKTFEIIEEY